jgi:hypothetical protein
MTEWDVFTIAEEFAGVDFNEERLGKRFRQTVETLSKDLRRLISWCGNSLKQTGRLCIRAVT